jgi:signal transduction histidine kinase
MKLPRSLRRSALAALTSVGLLALVTVLRQSTQPRRSTAQWQRRREVEAERDRLEAEVNRRTSDLTALAQGLQTAREDERGRLARELHDELGGLLTAVKLDAARLKSGWPDMPAAAAERLQHMNQHLNQGIALKRRIIEDLLPSSLKNLGLLAALQILISEFSERSEIVIDSELALTCLTPTADLTVYRLVQEALTNVAKYAQATRVDIRLSQQDGHAEIVVSDDGVGFDTEASRRSAQGLMGMRYRVEAEGGQFMLASAIGQGTRVGARIPARQALPAQPAQVV